MTMRANEDAAATRRPAAQSESSGNSPATLAAGGAFPAVIAELEC